ncbi:cysteine desulfurase [Natranaerovirga hydrolytica]|uniref:Cysteine desulfurase n=1 Tax=Natranaerovirga hydrolytica TaxID=680378 RepID=A0A4R1MJH7_9FIRM|nr:cysteine desulfurase family protein [Natranaerovirga hydrolytica]TCK92647.1 cysteine desulfurase [Natranaerovirga hydrolytica]
MIYLDYAANTPASEAVLHRFIECEQAYPMNPNSNNLLAKEGKQRLEQAKEQIAEALAVQPQELIFTSSGTESNNLAIKGIAKEYGARKKHIITSFLEHSSVLGPIGALEKDGYDIEYVEINNEGQVDIAHLKELLREDTLMVALCQVDSEVGIVQDIESIGQVIKENSSALFHVDGTQAVGKLFQSLKYVDSYTFAGHKIYGLNGSACLVLKENVMIEPLHHGGLSISPYRSGTPSLGLIDSLACALSEMNQKMKEQYQYVQALNKALRSFFNTFDCIRINSTNQSVPFILNITIKGIQAESVKDQLSQHNIYVSTKSACSAPLSPSRAVFALTKDKKGARSTLRISLSHWTTKSELEQFQSAFKRIVSEGHKE